MLSRLDSRELSEWMAFFVLQNKQRDESAENLEVGIKNEFEMYNIGVKK